MKKLLKIVLLMLGLIVALQDIKAQSDSTYYDLLNDQISKDIANSYLTLQTNYRWNCNIVSKQNCPEARSRNCNCVSANDGGVYTKLDQIQILDFLDSNQIKIKIDSLMVYTKILDSLSVDIIIRKGELKNDNNILEEIKKSDIEILEDLILDIIIERNIYNSIILSYVNNKN